MTCASCAISVESMLKNHEGVKNAVVNFAANQVNVTYDNAVTDPKKMADTIALIGYELVVNESEEQNKEKINEAYLRLRRRTIWTGIFTLPVFVLGMFFMHLPYSNWISLVLSLPVVFVFGAHFYVNAWKKLLQRQFNMDTLVAMSTGIAFVFSVFNTVYPEFWHRRGIHPHVYFEAATVIIAFVTLGKFLEENAKSTTTAALKKLMGLQSKTATRIIDGKENSMPIEEVQINDELVIKAGEKIPVDGIVVSGSSSIDESSITGESLPKEVNKDDKVFAGTINQKGSFVMKAQKIGATTLLSQIIHTVQQAQGSKAPVQARVDKIASVFVPSVMVLAALTFVLWMLFAKQNAFEHGLLASITVLIIACPCALGLATPTAIMVGIGKGASNQLLIKDAECLEQARLTDTIILDKTGTITEGNPKLTSEYWNESSTTHDKNLLYTIESRAQHPLGDAIIQHLKQSNVELINLHSTETITGKGIKAIAANGFFLVGKPAYIIESGIKIDEKVNALIEQWEEQAQTIIVFTNEKEVLAAFAVSDTIKQTSVEAIKKLESMGIAVHMLTGDNEKTAAAIAAKAGIKNYKAGQLPIDKANYIKALQQNGHHVAMVGDGINDSTALAQADLSIAMGKGSDIAMDVAKVTIMNSDLNGIAKVIQLSKRTSAGIKQNLFWAFIYNLIGIPLAAGILYPLNGFLLDPMLAGAAMALSSVSVVSNSLRIKWSNLS